MKNKSYWIITSVLFCFFLLISYISTNIENIYLIKAKYYLKKENLAEVQVALEKAFSHGLQNSDYREIYINSIINSPLTITSQEKIIKFLDYPIEDGAKSKAEYFIYDLKRELHKRYSENYITQAVSNKKIIRWGELPITYSIQSSKDIPIYFTREIENAITEWEKLTENQLFFAEDNENPNIIIKFNNHNPTDSEEQKYIVAYTSPTIVNDKLKNMTITFYTKDPNDKYFSSNQVYNTALHELVHAIGFIGHSNNKKNIMYLSKDSMTYENDSRSQPTEADINTVKLLYRIKPDITNSDKLKGEYLPYLILGDEEEITSAKIKEAKIYISKAPHLPNGYIDLAEGYVATKQYAKAIKNLDKALLLANTEEFKAMINYNLAVTYYYISHYDLAKDYLDKSMEYEKTEAKCVLLAEIYVKQKDYEKAKNEYKYLLKISPQNINYCISLTNLYLLERNYHSARKVLREFIEKNPNERFNSKLKSYGILKLGL